MRDELVYNSERPLSDEELKEYETELSKYDVEGSIKDFTNPIKIGDGTRTIGSCIQQFFQQVVWIERTPNRWRLGKHHVNCRDSKIMKIQIFYYQGNRAAKPNN